MKTLINTVFSPFGYTKQVLFLLFAIFLVEKLNAQFQVRITTIESRCSANGQILLDVTGGASPYSFLLLNSTRPVQVSNVFNALPPATYQVRITDFNGANMVVNATISGNYTPPTATCSVNGYNVTMNATGGRPPYKYDYALYRSQAFTNTQSSSILTCLPNGTHNFRVTDSCGNTYVTTCEVDVKPLSDTIICEHANGLTNVIATSFLGGIPPYTFTCTTNFGDTLRNSTGRFMQLRGCNFIVRFADQCQRKETSLECSTLRGYVKCANFNTKTATVWAEGGTPPYRFRALDRSGFSDTGVYADLTANQGSYYFSVTDACGTLRFFDVSKMQLGRVTSSKCPFEASLGVVVNQNVTLSSNCLSCSSFYPYRFNCLNCTPPLTYIDSLATLNNPLSPLAIFNNQPPGIYNIVVTNGCQDTIHIKAESKPSSPELSAVYDCKTNTIIAKTNLTGVPGTVYILRDTFNRTLSTNTTGVFLSPYTGIFWVFAAVPNCDTAYRPVSTRPQPQVCFFESSKTDTSNKCVFKWFITAELPTPSVYRLKKMTDSVFTLNTTGRFTDLEPNQTYILKTDCSTDTFKTPSAVYPKLEIAYISACAYQSNIVVKGARVIQRDSLHCYANYRDEYVLFDNKGRLISGNLTGIFPALPEGRTYQVRAKTPEGCFMDSLSFQTTQYTRPVLTASYGVICAAGQTTGSVRMILRGGVPPFNYEITSPLNFKPPIMARDTTALFTELPAGNYTLRVTDSCGNSSDYATSVGPLNFTPQYKRECNGQLTLSAPFIDGATYIWKNQTGNTVGNQRAIKTNETVAQTYTLTLTTPQPCSYTASVNVPRATPSQLKAEAGVDFASNSLVATLSANSLAAGLSGTWRLIEPSSGTATFDNPNNPNTIVRVSNLPGSYTFVWEVTDNVNGCSLTDTVVGVFCIDVTLLAVKITTTVSECRKPTGKASVSVLNASTPLTYRWSNGKTTPSVDSLAVGKYTVTIDDDWLCSPPRVDTVVINAPAPIPPRTIDTTLCFGRSLSVGTKTYSQTGNYRDTLLSAQGCDSIIITKLIVNRLPIEALIPVHNLTAKYCGDSLALNARGDSSRNYQWLWQNVQCPTCHNPSILPLNTPVYYVTITDKTTKCSVKDSINITIEGSFTERVPNAFSPNGDGTNDVFNVIPDPCIQTTERLRIYNRWGQLIFDKTNLSPHKNEGWDALQNGKYLASDVYVFIMDILFVDGTSKRVSGEVNLIH